jgi:fatty acid desaturase
MPLGVGVVTFLAFVFVQLSYIVHDVGHRQVFNDSRRTTLSGLFFSNLLLGASQQWWVGKHNRHHGNPNQLGLDPDIDVPVIAFTQEQALGKHGLARFIVTHQAFFFFPLTSLLALSPRNLSIRYVLQKRDRAALVEAVLMLVHFALYLGVLFYQLGPALAIQFIIVHQMFTGLYMATVFAPNHKGMPVLDDNTPLDFLRRQVLTARNVKAHPLTDFWYGGLNYQIEHHLFPGMPRNNLREAQKIVRAFCDTHSISYHETSVFQSYREILQYLHEVSAPLRHGNYIDPQAEQGVIFSKSEGGVP